MTSRPGPGKRKMQKMSRSESVKLEVCSLKSERGLTTEVTQYTEKEGNFRRFKVDTFVSSGSPW